MTIKFEKIMIKMFYKESSGAMKLVGFYQGLPDKVS